MNAEFTREMYRKWLRCSGRTQQEIASATGIHMTTLSEFAKAKVPLPRKHFPTLRRALLAAMRNHLREVQEVLDAAR